MTNFFKRKLIKWLLTDYSITDKKISEGEMNQILVELARIENLDKMLNIQVSNLIRKHLYVKNMEEKNFYSGQIIAIRQLQERIKNAIEEYNKLKEQNNAL